MVIKHFKRLANVKLFKPALCYAILIAFTFSLSCGKRKSPLPPVERVQQRAEISGIQRGNKVILSWQMPAQNAPAGSVLNIDRIEIYRIAEEISSPDSLTEEEFASRSTLIASLTVSTDDFSRKVRTYSDSLDFAGQPARLRYSIRFVNASGQRAAFSNFLSVVPTAKTSAPPSGLLTEVTSEYLKLSWNIPGANIDGSKPVNILGYNLYRRLSGTENFALLNKTPINKSEFADSSFEFGTTYEYFVRTVSLSSLGQPIESLDSNLIAVKPIDTFPPTAPAAITLAATPNSLSIFFAFNPEKDIAGYRIYRSEEKTLPKGEWRLLTPALLTTNIFQDKNVASGKTYYYYLMAVDRFGNISESSEVVSETIP